MSWMLPLTVNSGTLQIRIPSNTMAIPNNVDKKAKGRETDSMVCFAAKFSFIQNRAQFQSRPQLATTTHFLVSRLHKKEMPKVRHKFESIQAGLHKCCDKNKNVSNFKSGMIFIFRWKSHMWQGVKLLFSCTEPTSSWGRASGAEPDL